MIPIIVLLDDVPVLTKVSSKSCTCFLLLQRMTWLDRWQSPGVLLPTHTAHGATTSDFPMKGHSHSSPTSLLLSATYVLPLQHHQALDFVMPVSSCLFGRSYTSQMDSMDLDNP